MTLSNINTSEIECYKKFREDEKAKPTTINRELAALSHLFTQAVEWRWLDKKPGKIKTLKEGQGRIVYLTIEHIERFTEAGKKIKAPISIPSS